MISTITINKKTYDIDLSKPIDLSIPLRSGKKNVNAFHIPPVSIEPIRMGSFVGSVNRGGSCNVNNIHFNPHGNGTHTECVGHISREFISLNQCLTHFFFTAKLITIEPQRKGEDAIIMKSQVVRAVKSEPAEALIIRTEPNPKSRQTMDYSGSNPPYLDPEAAAWMRESGIDHLILDVPSVDREVDGGKLLAHHAFWNYPAQPRMQSTITELAYVPEKVKDGNYLLNLMIASFENDASPSKPVLYAMKQRP